MPPFFSRTLALVFACFPAAALAHIGQGGHGFMDGLAHPFLGMDHLLAMFVVGVWSVLHGRNVILPPLCFVVMLATSAVLGQNGFEMPLLEPLVAVSVLVLGIMLTLSFKLGSLPVFLLIGGFGLFHGLAHGRELSAGADVLVGIVLGSALLHAMGVFIARFFLKDSPRLVHRFGQLVAVLGGGLVFSGLLG